MKRLFLLVAALLLAACATIDLRDHVSAAQSGIDAYLSFNEQALARGRISGAEAVKAGQRALKANADLDAVRKAMAACVDLKNCASATSLLSNLQPNLLELERDLRAKEAAQKGAPK